jgi:hypothetical protein
MTSATGTVPVFPARRRTAARVGPVKCCPTCRTELDEGPVVYRCRPCGKAVCAADIDTEYHAPAVGADRSPLSGRAA